MRRLPRLLLYSAWLLLTAAPTALHALCGRTDVERPRIGLVLGGGGARGSAHIGVIRVLEELRVPVDFVAGTSFGALVGALLATGMTAAELEQVLRSLDWADLFQDEVDRQDLPVRRKRDDRLALFGPKIGVGSGASLIPKGAIAGQKISILFETWVRQRTQAERFDDLPIPYRAVAADVISGAEVVFTEGDLAVAMRASMSVPGVFDPVQHGDRLLVDGGIVNNLPVDVARSMGADIVIAVDVGSGLIPRDQLKSALAIVGQLSNLMIKSNTDPQRASLGADDVLIVPDLGERVGSTDFARTTEGIDIGQQAAVAMRDRLAARSLSIADYATYRAAVESCVQPWPDVDFVRLANDTRLDDQVLRSRLRVRAGKRLDYGALDEDLMQIHALGAIGLARYRAVTEHGASGVSIEVTPDARGTRLLEWGLDYDGDGDSSSINARVGYLDAAVDGFGSELRVLAQIGEDPAFLADVYKYLSVDRRWFVEPQLFAERRELTAYEDGDALGTSQVTQYGGAVAVGREIGRNAALAAGLRGFDGRVRGNVGAAVADADYVGVEYFADAGYDRIDSRYLPGRGLLIEARYQSSRPGLGADASFDQLLIDGLAAASRDRHTLIAGVRYYETVDGIAPAYAQFRAGGFGRLSGLQDEEAVGQHFAMLLGGYRYRVAGLGLLPAHVGMTLEYGRAADATGDLLDDALVNGSLYFGYRSPIGPLYLGAGFAEGGRQRYFLRIGNIFGNSTIGR